MLCSALQFAGFGLPYTSTFVVVELPRLAASLFPEPASLGTDDVVIASSARGVVARSQVFARVGAADADVCRIHTTKPEERRGFNNEHCSCSQSTETVRITLTYLRSK